MGSIIGTKSIIQTTRVDEVVDDRVRVISSTGEQLEDAFGSPDDMFLIYPDAGAPDLIAGNEGDLAGTWLGAPPYVEGTLTTVAWAQGDGGATCYRSSSMTPQELAGGGGLSHVIRTLLVWDEGAIASFRQLLGNSTASGSINTSAIVYFANATEIVFAQQYGSKTNTNVTFTLPFTLATGAVLLPVFEKVDEGGGTQRVRCWVNGEPCAVASVLNGTDNGDGSATIQDGTPNGTTQFCWLGILFSTGIGCFGRMLQVGRYETSDAQEARLATLFLGSVGDPMLP